MRRWFTYTIEVLEVEGKFVAISGWNGEMYLDCWLVEQEDKDVYYEFGEDTRPVRPIYEVNPEDEDDWEVVGYEFV